MNKCMGRRGAFLYVCTALGFLLPVTCNVKQTWLCVAPPAQCFMPQCVACASLEHSAPPQVLWRASPALGSQARVSWSCFAILCPPWK